jgi:hypothetical protein
VLDGVGAVQQRLAAQPAGDAAGFLDRRRGRLGVPAAALMAGITYLAGPGGSTLPAGLRQGSWLTGAGFPDPAVCEGHAKPPVSGAAAAGTFR